MELEALMETGASLGLTGDDLRRWIDEERRTDREQRTAAERYRGAHMDPQSWEKMEKERHSLELQERLRQVGALTDSSYPIVPHNISQGDKGACGYRYDAHVETGSNGVCTFLLTAISIFFIILTFPLSLLMCIKIVQEYERAVIFRLGRLVKGGARGPGLFFIIPCIDNYTKVDLRTVSFDVPPQEILTKDSVTVAVDAVVYYRIQNATVAVTNVEDYGRSTRLLAATTLRNVLGTKSLSEILSEREAISHTMQANLDEATDAWGVKVERVEIKDVRLPVQMQRAMAAEAEASREARAKVIAAEGEQRAARSLKEAADVISESGPALQLRYLQTLTSIAAEKNSTIVFPLPMELLKGLLALDRTSSQDL
ncbi:stomatin isoform X1 [Rhipicephalus sanguineus]|uniref:stomatin isoform X1 n=1 Tax=Rhipicephalus sanguineus TaxID=34632 RepID=UPI0020C2038E|nr:stomatin isoform X1 [Rhipicephalus sanguineus]